MARARRLGLWEFLGFIRPPLNAYRRLWRNISEFMHIASSWDCGILLAVLQAIAMTLFESLRKVRTP